MIDITINNQTFNANGYECCPTLIEMGDRTRTLDGVDHSEGYKIKRLVKATFVDIEKDELSRILKACLSSPLIVTYFDTLNNEFETREFVLQNNPTATIKIWKSHLKYYNGTTIELLEKGAE